MGIYDRDWWRDRDKHADRSNLRGAARGDHPSQSAHKLAGWPRVLLVVCVLAAAAYLLHRHKSLPDGSIGAQGKGAGRLFTSAVSCTDPFPAAGMVTGNLEAWNNANHRAETLFENLTPTDVIVALQLNGASFAKLALPAASRTRLNVPMGSFNWQIVAGENWCNRLWSFSDARVTHLNGSLDIIPGRRLSVRVTPQGETFRINLSSRAP